MREEVYLDGRPLSSIAWWGDLKWSERFDGGCWEASWEMEVRRGWSHPVVRRGADVEIRVGGHPVWAGLLAEPDRDSWQMTATGLSREGERYAALNTDGTPSRYVGAATVEAVSKGLPWRYAPIDFPAHANPVLTVEGEGLNKVSTLWSEAAKAAGWFWGVGSDRIPYARPRPTEPSWSVAPGVVDLGLADDDFATHLIGQYLTVSMTRETVVRGDDGAAGTPSWRWGRSEHEVDLTARGPMIYAQAAAILDGMLVKAGPRPGYTNGLELAAHEITTAGGARAFLPRIRKGEMVRLYGVNDEATGRPYHDIVIGEVRHEGIQTVYIEPLGIAERNLAAVIEGAPSAKLVA